MIIAQSRERLFSVEGKIALITGGSRGIGLMIARGLVEQGARVYISSRKADQCAAAAHELDQIGECIALPFDIAAMTGIEGLVSHFGAQEGKLDILINNAGATWGAPLDCYSEQGWDKVMDLNVKSLFFLTQKLLGPLRAAASRDAPARVINIASINGLTNPHMDNYAYSASKAAVMHLTRHLSSALASDAITVNAIAPGYFPTSMIAHLPLDKVGASIPLGRVGDGDDAAGAAIFLASRASAWITGAVLPVDGGLVAAA